MEEVSDLGIHPIIVILFDGMRYSRKINCYTFTF